MSAARTTSSSNFPEEGITIIATFPHTHLQGKTVWTKLIKNKKAEQYIFNAETYDFNYQYENRLTNTIKLQRGDEFATRCIYNTMNKNTATLGGERTKDEMCLHMMTYYPRMTNMYGCVMKIHPESWLSFMNSTSSFDYLVLRDWILNQTWTPERRAQWQEFYTTASRLLLYGAAPNLQFAKMPSIPAYEDFKPLSCSRDLTMNGALRVTTYGQAMTFLYSIPILMMTLTARLF